jgi:chlorobactene glucosyltransferase
MSLDRNAWRFTGLGALTLAAIGAAVRAARALRVPEKVPEVDATSSLPPGGGEWPFVSIVVPARNEERNLPRLLPTLLAQHYPAFEVIVVDDQSTDATSRILVEWQARDPRLKVVRGEELPREEGWKGKPHAMYQGAREARGEWILFTDADTTHSPAALASTMSFALARHIDLFTMGPTAELGTVAEKIIMPVAYEGISILYPNYLVNDPNSSTAIANGQYMLIRRSVYDAVGGAERVKDKIAEDLEFGKAVKSDGYRLYFANGTHLMNVRMYTNFDEIWEGWSKNVVLSFQHNPAQGALAVLGTVSIGVMPPVFAWWAVRARRSAAQNGTRADRIAANWITALAAAVIGLPIFFRVRVDRMLGISPAWSLTQPIGGLVFALIMATSALRLLTGKGVTWKGRTYGT